jgi:hypothetical protein
MSDFKKNHIAKAFYPMMPSILSKEIVAAALHKLHLPPWDHVPPPIFDY